MTQQAHKISLTFCLTMVLAFLFDQAEGITWTNNPSSITMCAHKTAKLALEYDLEDYEQVIGLEWRVNILTQIAHMNYNGYELTVEPSFFEQVAITRMSPNVIFLKNITAKDNGMYSLHIQTDQGYPTLWESTHFRSIWLNVIYTEEVTKPNWCTCERLPIPQEWNGGRNIYIMTDGCNLYINSTHCCLTDPTYKCNDNNPQDLCLPIQRPIENVTSVRNTNQITDSYTQRRRPAEGIIWTNTPSPITMCAHETVQLTWEYQLEDKDGSFRLQWFFNDSKQIAPLTFYNAETRSFTVAKQYYGRVVQYDLNEIFLTNITHKDSGKYTLLIDRDSTNPTQWQLIPNSQSIWLNVIDADEETIPQWCTCERLSILQEWNSGQNMYIVTEDCKLEINSTHCCIREQAYRCKKNNPHDVCLPIRRPIENVENVTSVRSTNQLTDNYTQNGPVTEGIKHTYIEDNTVIIIAIIGVYVCVIVIVTIIIFILRHRKKKFFMIFKEMQDRIRILENSEKSDIPNSQSHNEDHRDNTGTPF